MSNEKIFNKIKKCLELSKSSNEHESAAALRQAHALMKKHNIELSDVEQSKIARFFGVDIGEHSSANCPWDNAYEAIPTGDIESLKAEWKAEALEKSDVDEQAIRSAIDAIQEMHKQYDALNQVLSLDHGGPFINAIWQLENQLIKALDIDGWLEWFVLDSNFGSSGLAAGFDGASKPIRSINDLIELMKEAERRH